ncbi:MAG: hypothetical protein RLZZ584_2493, partial [Pseudomonadota bacterium]
MTSLTPTLHCPSARSAVALACLLNCALGAVAAETAATNAAGIAAASVGGLEAVTITGQPRSVAREPQPATHEAITSQQIEESINTVTTAGTLQYLPSVHVRERYIGDRNGILVMRVNSSVASAQTTVYADGLLLSNFLNNSFSTAPRWGMVSPEEIDRVDILYGPYSALYPGNSAGGVVNIATRLPTRFEAHAKVDAFTQRYKLYGTDERFNGGHASLALGDQVGDWSYWLALDHLKNRSQPQTFSAATAKAGAPATAGNFVDVSGSAVYRDVDTAGKPRIIVASTGIDDTTQDFAKARLAYRITPTLQAGYSLGWWRNSSEGSVDSYLRDAAGRTVYNAGSAFNAPLKFVRIDGQDYTVAAAVPSRSSSEHLMHGLSLKSDADGPWRWDLNASLYDQSRDSSRTAAPRDGYDTGLGAVTPGGQLTLADGTGWHNLDARGQWRGAEHTLSFGAHHDRYHLASVTWTVDNWQGSDTGTLGTSSYGTTRTNAVYLQDEWRFAPAWSLIAGGRQEAWQASGGSNYNAANAAPNPRTLVYGERSYSNFSPKLHLAHEVSDALALSASFGKGVRYPTVAEMFQTFTGPNNIRTNDPNLKPEQVNSVELVAQQKFGANRLRTSLFLEDKRDALISQTDVTVTPNISSIQNVDKVRTRGIELAGEARNAGLRGLDLNASVTYAHSIIVADSRNPGLEGTAQPR